MVKNKVAMALAGAALVTTLHGGVAHADDAGDPSGDRMNVSVLCSEFGLTVRVDTDGDGTYDTSFTGPSCGWIRGHVTL